MYEHRAWTTTSLTDMLTSFNIVQHPPMWKYPRSALRSPLSLIHQASYLTTLLMSAGCRSTLTNHRPSNGWYVAGVASNATNYGVHSKTVSCAILSWFSVYWPILWNSLPPHLQTINLQCTAFKYLISKFTNSLMWAFLVLLFQLTITVTKML